MYGDDASMRLIAKLREEALHTNPASCVGHVCRGISHGQIRKCLTTHIIHNPFLVIDT